MGSKWHLRVAREIGKSMKTGSPHAALHHEIKEEVFVQLQEALALPGV